MELCDHSAKEMTDLLRSRQASAVEILESAMKRIEQVDGVPGTLDYGDLTEEDERTLHAFITVTGDRARAQAEEVDKQIKAGEDPGLLAGVPFSTKDMYCVEGVPSTAASRILSTFVSPYTATPVARMEAQGGINIGKVNLDEFAFGGSTESSAFQPSTRNPWDTSQVPGGSSGGSAASVASGEVALSLGTDTAGSIRLPAAFCGTVGLKPTYGRVSRYGSIALASSLDCPGPLARNVTDTAMMLQVIAGQDEHDSTAATMPVPDYLEKLEAGVKGMHIGISPDYLRITFPDPETGEYAQQDIPEDIKAPVLQATKLLKEMGAEIVEDVPLKNTKYAIPAYFVYSRVEAASNLHRYDGVKYGYRASGELSDMAELYRKSRGAGFGHQVQLRILMGMYVSAAQYSEQYYQRALKVRTLIRRDFEEAFDKNGKYKLDALLTPSTPMTAFPMGAVFGDSILMQYADQLSVPANHAGIPGLSVPAGFSDKGLPVGIQFLGSDFSEDVLLRLGRSYEMATEGEDWRKAKPAILESLG